MYNTNKGVIIMNFKRITAIVLILVFVFSLGACKTKTDKYEKSLWTNVFKMNYLEAPEDNNFNYVNYRVIGDTIYVVLTKEDPVYTDDGYRSHMNHCNQVQIYNFDCELLDAIDFDFEYYNRTIFPSGEDTFYLYSPYALAHVNREGETIWEAPFENANSQYVFFDADSNYFYCTAFVNEEEHAILVYNTEGEMVNYIVLDGVNNKGESFREITKSPDGQILLQYQNFQSNAAYDISYYLLDGFIKYEYGEPEIPFDYRRKYFGAGFSNEFEIYFTNENGLYGYNADDENPTIIINWLNSDMADLNFNIVSVISSDLVLCGVADYYSVDYKLTLMKRVPDEQLAKVNPISLATWNYSSDLKMIISKFNRQSDDYRVFLEDYSVLRTADDWNRGQQIFDIDIASGIVYDLILIGGDVIFTEKYMNKNMFADLYDFMEDKNNLIGMIRGRYETDEHLYMFPASYFFNSISSKVSVMGSKENITLDEIIEIYDNLPPGVSLFSNLSGSSVYECILRASINDYIDFENGTCNFDGGDFVKMIKFAKLLPDPYYTGFERIDGIPYYTPNVMPKEAIKNNNFYFYYFNSSSISAFITLKWLYGEDDYVVIGYPNSTGTGLDFTGFNHIGITEKSKNKEGAWEFIKFWLSDEIQMSNRYMDLPITNSALETVLNEYLNKEYIYIDLNYNSIYMPDKPLSDYSLLNDPFELIDFTEKDAEKTRRFFNNMQVTRNYPSTARDIIWEEVRPYFEGSVTAEQCAAYIQNRVSTYLYEQR